MRAIKWVDEVSLRVEGGRECVCVCEGGGGGGNGRKRKRGDRRVKFHSLSSAQHMVWLFVLHR